MVEKARLLVPQIPLDTNIEDIARILECEDMVGAILVGGSFGGMAIAAGLPVWEH